MPTTTTKATTSTPTTYVAYFRVSTDRQGRSGLGLDAQRAATTSFVNEHGGQIVEEIIEVESGKVNGRPELRRAIEIARGQKATLLIAKLDRLARSVAFISNLMESGVSFVAADMPSATPFMLHIYAAVAEEERRMISQRTKVALAAAKARGVRLGNTTNLSEAQAKGRQTTVQTATERAQDLKPVLTDLRARGLSFQKIADHLNKAAIPTPTGGQWHPSSVRNHLKRLELTESR